MSTGLCSIAVLLKGRGVVWFCQQEREDRWEGKFVKFTNELNYADYVLINNSL